MSWSGFEPCTGDDRSVLIIALIINGLLCIAIITLSCSAIYQMLSYHKSSNKNNASLFYGQLSFYIICIITAASRIPDILLSCFSAGSTAERALFGIVTSSYGYHWVAFLFVLFCRLKIVFDGTALQLGNCFKKISISILIIVSISGPISYILLLLNVLSWQSATGVYQIFTVLLLMIFSQVLSFTFVRKLYLLHKVSENSQEGMIGMVTKYTILGLISTVSTFIIVISSGIMTTGEYTAIVYILNISGQMLDVFVDVFCISLAFKFYEKYYMKICNICDLRCKSFCLSLTNESKLVEMSKISVQNNELPSQSPSSLVSSNKE